MKKSNVIFAGLLTLGVAPGDRSKPGAEGRVREARLQRPILRLLPQPDPRLQGVRVEGNMPRSVRLQPGTAFKGQFPNR